MAPRHWLRARVVVIACLGNNDCADGQDDRSSGLLRTGGIRVLRNNVALLPGVSVLGVDDVIHCKGNLGPAKIAYDKQMRRSEEHTSELQSLMRISYAVFCLKQKNKLNTTTHIQQTP